MTIPELIDNKTSVELQLSSIRIVNILMRKRNKLADELAELDEDIQRVKAMVYYICNEVNE